MLTTVAEESVADKVGAAGTVRAFWVVAPAEVPAASTASTV
jgi:hypothetical protein